MDKKPVSIDDMKDLLEQFGDQQIWQGIETVGDWKVRTTLRSVFFTAGGKLEND